MSTTTKQLNCNENDFMLNFENSVYLRASIGESLELITLEFYDRFTRSPFCGEIQSKSRPKSRLFDAHERELKHSCDL